MKPKQLRVPAPVHHRPSGRDVVFVRDAEGKRRRVWPANGLADRLDRPR